MKQAKSNPVGWGPVASHWDETRSRVAKSMVFRSMTFFFGGEISQSLRSILFRGGKTHQLKDI